MLAQHRHYCYRADAFDASNKRNADYATQHYSASAREQVSYGDPVTSSRFTMPLHATGEPGATADAASDGCSEAGAGNSIRSVLPAGRDLAGSVKRLKLERRQSVICLRQRLVPDQAGRGL